MILASLLLAAMPAFSQLSLADAQSRAVAASVDVAIARANVHQREAALEIARSGGVPHLIGTYALAPQAGPFDQTVSEQRIFTVAAGISVNDVLAASSQTRSAASDLIAAQRRTETATLLARENAVKLYFGALQAISLEAAREASVHGAQSDRDVAAIRASNGAAPHLDVVRADVSLAQAQADLARAQADRANAVDALASATGISADSLSSTGATLPEPGSVLDEAHAIARALASRPEVAALLATIDARGDDIESARIAGWPVATADGGYAGGVDSGQSVHGPAANVSLDIPLAPATGARVAAAQAAVDTSRAQLFDVRRTIALEAAAAVRDARALDEAATAAGRARDEALRALSAVEIGYREGASSSLDVADARRTATQASVDALVARYQRAQAYALLEVIAP